MAVNRVKELLTESNRVLNEVERGHFETYEDAFKMLGQGTRLLAEALLTAQLQAEEAAIIAGGR